VFIQCWLLNTEHYLVVAKVGERLAVNKEQHHVEVSNRFGALEDLDEKVEINSCWETIRGCIKISAKLSTMP
jgi:hypothetical protein